MLDGPAGAGLAAPGRPLARLGQPRLSAAAVDAGRDQVVREGIELGKGQFGSDGRESGAPIGTRTGPSEASSDRRHVVIGGERRLVEADQSGR